MTNVDLNNNIPPPPRDAKLPDKSLSRRDDPVAELAGRVLAASPEIVERLGDLYRATDPDYGALSPETLRNEVLPISRLCIDKFFSALAAGRRPDANEVPELEAMGRRRLELGVSLESMLHVYRIGGRAIFEAVIEAARPGEERAVGTIGALWMDFLDQLSSRSATGYITASHEVIRRVEARRGALLQAVLAARDSTELAAVCTEFSLTLAPEYVPVVAVGDEALSRLDAVLSVSPSNSLVGARPRGVLVLAAKAPHLNRLRNVTGSAAVIWGRPTPPGADLGAEVDHLEQVVEIILAKGMSGLYGPNDLLLEQLVAGSPRAQDQLVQKVLQPILHIDHSGMLLSTLRTYLDTGSVSLTAKLEFSHPNSVTYRLRRVAALTGYDARIPRDAAALVVALVALAEGSTSRR